MTESKRAKLGLQPFRLCTPLKGHDARVHEFGIIGRGLLTKTFFRPDEEREGTSIKLGPQFALFVLSSLGGDGARESLG